MTHLQHWYVPEAYCSSWVHAMAGCTCPLASLPCSLLAFGESTPPRASPLHSQWQAQCAQYAGKAMYGTLAVTSQWALAMT